METEYRNYGIVKDNWGVWSMHGRIVTTRYGVRSPQDGEMIGVWYATKGAAMSWVDRYHKDPIAIYAAPTMDARAGYYVDYYDPRRGYLSWPNMPRFSRFADAQKMVKYLRAKWQIVNGEIVPR